MILLKPIWKSRGVWASGVLSVFGLGDLADAMLEYDGHPRSLIRPAVIVLGGALTALFRIQATSILTTKPLEFKMTTDTSILTSAENEAGKVLGDFLAKKLDATKRAEYASLLGKVTIGLLAVATIAGTVQTALTASTTTTTS